VIPPSFSLHRTGLSLRREGQPAANLRPKIRCALVPLRLGPPYAPPVNPQVPGSSPGAGANPETNQAQGNERFMPLLGLSFCCMIIVHFRYLSLTLCLRPGYLGCDKVAISLRRDGRS
jgi:hypothetical protein